MKRRDFIKGAAVLGAGVGAGLSTTLLGPRTASAAPFGEVPEGAEGALVPPENRAESILEIFLYGGISQYESFYCIEEYGQVDKTGWYCFLDVELPDALAACGYSGPLLQPFAPDANGLMVKFGPFVKPLRDRTDVLERTRVLITAHDLEPHEGAIPLALAGRGLGHPALAGMGAHVQRYYLDRNDDPGRPPFSYVLLSSSLNAFPTDNLRSAIAIGLHPGAARPLSLKVDASGDMTALLARQTVGASRAQYDALLQGYIDRYRQRLRFRGEGEPLRSPRLGDLAAGAAAVANAEAISTVLESQFFQKVGGTVCGQTVGTDAVTMNLKLATHLLTHPTAPARYVCVIDGGFIPADGGGGYDTHGENCKTQARNLGHTLTQLMGLINQPGESDPDKLDLDRTIVLITTEFGRTPFRQGGPTAQGRNHWPYGYPNVLIGGPVTAGRHGVYGATGPDAKAGPIRSTPAANRMAALLGLGIWPFSSEAYNVADVPGATSEADAATKIKQNLLGYV